MINVGVIGVGNMGLHHARNYSEIASARLCAVSDFDLQRAQAVAARYGGNAYRDYNEMLAREPLDAVSIAVPTHLHYRVASNVIQAGVHLLVEKPLAATLAEAESLVAEAH